MQYQQLNPEKEADPRFQRLLGEAAWNRLPPAIRARFGKRVKGGASVAYRGLVTRMDFSFVGRLLAQATRLIGAPLPFDSSSMGHPAVVIVTEDAQSDGQFWVRQYGRAKGFPHVVQSSKRFQGATGLEEYIGCGIGMALRVEATEHALLFKSDHYFVQLGQRRIKLPKALCPGALTIGHHALADGRFRFSLHLYSKILGDLICQDAEFVDG